MAEKDVILKESVDYTGIYSYPAFYGFAHSWLNDEKEYGVIEEKYAEKISGNSKAIDIEWKATKKISDYFKIEISVKFEIKNLVDVEVEIDGKKKKSNQGKVKVEIKGVLIKDYNSEWDVSKGWRFMRDLYNKYLVPSRVDAMEGKVVGDVKEFKEELKAFLEVSGRR